MSQSMLIRRSLVVIAFAFFLIVPEALPQVSAQQVAASTSIPTATNGDWPWWRAPHFDGVAPGTSAPIEWNAEKNIAWQTEIPGRGHASPCVVGNQIFISTALEDEEEMRLIAYDRQSGAERWNVLLHQGGFMHTHNKNSQASGTPACNGSQVFVAHMVNQDDVDGVFLSAVSSDGKVLWQKKAGPFNTRHGYGSSPVLYGGLVIVVGDSDLDDPFVAAFEQATGKEAWRTKRSPQASFGCPVVASIAGRDQLIIPGCNETVSYNPADGQMLWRVDGPSTSAANTVAFDETKVYSSGGWPEKNLLAIRADGIGDVTETHIEWNNSKSICYVPTMLVHNGRLFTVSDDGVANCIDSATGDTIWTKRLGGKFSASPVLVGENIYIPDESGKTHIFAAADEFSSVGENDLEDGGFATPVVLDGKIYLRTSHKLYCIAE